MQKWSMYDDWLEVFRYDRINVQTIDNVYDTFTNLVQEDTQREQEDND